MSSQKLSVSTGENSPATTIRSIARGVSFVSSGTSSKKMSVKGSASSRKFSRKSSMHRSMNRKKSRSGRANKKHQEDPLVEILGDRLLSLWEKGPKVDLQPDCFARLCFVAAFGENISSQTANEYFQGLIDKHYEPMKDEMLASPEAVSAVDSRAEDTGLETNTSFAENTMSMDESTTTIPGLPPRVYTDATGLLLCHSGSLVALVEGTEERALKLLSTAQQDADSGVSPFASAAVVAFTQNCPSRIYTSWNARKLNAKREGGIELQDDIVNEQEEVYMNMVSLGTRLAETTFGDEAMQVALDNVSTKFASLITSAERLEMLAKCEDVMSVAEAVQMYCLPVQASFGEREWPVQKLEDDLNKRRRAYLSN